MLGFVVLVAGVLVVFGFRLDAIVVGLVVLIVLVAHWCLGLVMVWGLLRWLLVFSCVVYWFVVFIAGWCWRWWWGLGSALFVRGFALFVVC